MQEEKQKIRQYAVATLMNIWNSINWENIDSKRAFGIWDEFTNKVKASAFTTNKYETFVEKLCKKLNVNSLKHREILDIGKKDEETKQEIMKLFREETLSIVLEVKMNKEVIKEQKQLEKERKERDNEN